MNCLQFSKDSLLISCDEISEADAVDFFTKVWDEPSEPEILEEVNENVSQDDAGE